MSSNLQPVVVLIYAINFHVFSLKFFFLQLSITGTGFRKEAKPTCGQILRKKKTKLTQKNVPLSLSSLLS